MFDETAFFVGYSWGCLGFRGDVDEHIPQFNLHGPMSEDQAKRFVVEKPFAHTDKQNNIYYWRDGGLQKLKFKREVTIDFGSKETKNNGGTDAA